MVEAKRECSLVYGEEGREGLPEHQGGFELDGGGLKRSALCGSQFDYIEIDEDGEMKVNLQTFPRDSSRINEGAEFFSSAVPFESRESHFRTV